jgi:nucleotide-binding universal stress UspA family protein
MKTILVPTDFSEHANHALDLAKQLALKHEMAIHLLHIVEQPGSQYITPVTGGAHDQMENVFVLRMIEKVKAKMQETANELAQEGIKTTFKVKIGNPFKQISSQIKGENYHLIVMGTQGASGLDEVMVGSNTEKVIRHATCPVVTLKEKADLDKIDDIVFAMSYFGQNGYLAEQLKEIQQLFMARVHLVTINTPGNFLVERNVASSLNKFIEEHQIDNYTINIYSDITEEEGIVHFAEDQNANAIAMATHGRTGISHLLTGSLSEDIANHSMLPVITFPLSMK